ncbi:hypothetical protein F5Y16DRAFT_403742 [Xylariaceae sp. FL0255]|nr:hypothetical protein F5Y16DRAFT_403742 [Xylariaceae sp. FL0255]
MESDPPPGIKWVPNIRYYSFLLDAVLKEAAVEGVLFIHHLGGGELHLSRPEEWAIEKSSSAEIKDMNREIKKLELAEWTRRASALVTDPTVAAMLEDCAGGASSVDVPQVTK